MSIDAMFAVPPAELVQARELSHTSVQWASRAARANLEARADDSHSNLGWHEGVQGLVSHPLDDGQRCQLGFSFSTGSLVWLVDGNSTALLALEQADEAAARTWCDEQLSAAGLVTTDHAEMPYELDPVDYRGFADAGAKEALATLGAWYAKSQSVLDGLVRDFGTMAVATPTVRCWPHHFDLGTLFVLDEDDPETARSVGVGFSPGDGSYAKPYFYCTPWPTPEALPEAPGPLHWHTEGFTSLVLPASHINTATSLDQTLASAVRAARDSLP